MTNRVSGHGQQLALDVDGKPADRANDSASAGPGGTVRIPRVARGGLTRVDVEVILDTEGSVSAVERRETDDS